MSFLSVPESTIGYTTSGPPPPPLPRPPRYSTDVDNDIETSSSNLCPTCSRWIFRCIPVIVVFLIIQCVRAIFFDQEAAFTIINITIGFLLFSSVIVLIFTFVSIQFYRIQQRNRPPLSFNGVGTITDQRRTAQLQQRRSQERSGVGLNRDDDAFMFDFLDDLDSVTLRMDNGVDGHGSVGSQICPRCNPNLDTASTSASSSSRHHQRCALHPSQRIKEQQRIEELLDIPPPYISPPSYEELSVDRLIDKLERTSTTLDNTTQTSSFSSSTTTSTITNSVAGSGDNHDNITAQSSLSILSMETAEAKSANHSIA